MANKALKIYTQEHGGRVSLLFLLFLLAIFQFIHAGFNAFAIICAIPLMVLLIIAVFRIRLFSFWVLILINYILQWKNSPLPYGIPMSLYNEMLEIILIALAIIDVKDLKFERAANIMFFSLLVWCGFCTLEVLNDTCGIGIDVGGWYTAARMMAFQLMYAFVVFTI